MSVCRSCDHDKASHTHFRAGSDCGQCACTSYARLGRPAFGAHRAHRTHAATIAVVETAPEVAAPLSA